ncbi:unnamed protein product [Gadus morhua 'NCC']
MLNYSTDTKSFRLRFPGGCSSVGPQPVRWFCCQSFCLFCTRWVEFWVDFYVQLNMSRCLEQTKFHLSVQGISEQLKLVVKMKCECDCGPVEEASPSCSGHGTLHWGTCR